MRNKWRQKPRPIHWMLATLSILGFCLGVIWMQSTRSWVTVYILRLPSGPFFISEDPKHPRLVQLRKQEAIDAVLAGKETDLERLLRLTQWSSQQFVATTPFPNYPPWDAIEILQRIRQKQTGGFCAQYAFVFGQICQSLGYNVRYVGIVNRAVNSGHALIEVYVPSLAKWIIFEPEFGRYYIDAKGNPLSALELHQYAVGKTKGTILEYPSRQPMKSDWLALFYNFKYMLRNNFLSVPVYHIYQPKPGGEELSFEPYQMRWIDRFTKNAREAFVSLTSDRPEDFEFQMDLQGPATPVRCANTSDFAGFAQSAIRGKLYRLRLPPTLLTQIVEQVFIQDPRFKPLN